MKGRSLFKGGGGGGGGGDPLSPGGVNSLVAGPSAAQMTQQEIARRQLVADLDEQAGGRGRRVVSRAVSIHITHSFA